MFQYPIAHLCRHKCFSLFESTRTFSTATMNSIISIALFSLFVSFATAVDLMAVCYSFTHTDQCKPSAAVGEKHARKLLAKQGAPRPQKRHLQAIDCGVFCDGWSTFCAEYMCDADTIGMTCPEIVAGAKEHMQSVAAEVGTDECIKQMDPNNLECLCVDQDK